MINVVVFHLEIRRSIPTCVAAVVNLETQRVRYVVAGDVLDNITNVTSVLEACNIESTHRLLEVGRTYGGVEFGHDDLYLDGDFIPFSGWDEAPQYAALEQKFRELATVYQHVPLC